MSATWKRWLACGAMTLLADAGTTAFGAAAKDRAPTELRVYFGTYTGGKSKGIYSSRLDLATGRVSTPELAGETKNPSFLAVHPDGRHLYSVGELADFSGRNEGAVVAWGIEGKTGALTPLNQQSSKGAHPCHLVVDKTGHWVLVANYTGGNVAVLPIQEGGKLGEASCVVPHQGWSVNTQRQREAHAHSINLDASNRFAVAADLGTDKLYVYEFDAKLGLLAPAGIPFSSLPPGSGPRHFAFHPNARQAFVINELSQTIGSYGWESGLGLLKPRAMVSSLPPELKLEGNSTAEVQVHPNGRFVYGSNRGHNSIAVYAIKKSGKRLQLVEHESTQGRTPRGFGIDPTGRWLLAGNQDSDSVVVFAIDRKTGALTPTGQTLEVGKPVCVKFVAVP